MIPLDLIPSSISITIKAYTNDYDKLFDGIGHYHDKLLVIPDFAEKKYIPYCINRLKFTDDVKDGEERSFVCSRELIYKGLYSITNQNAGDNYYDWLRWYRDNKDKTQNQMFVKGYLKDEVFNKNDDDFTKIDKIINKYKKYVIYKEIVPYYEKISNAFWFFDNGIGEEKTINYLLSKRENIDFEYISFVINYLFQKKEKFDPKKLKSFMDYHYRETLPEFKRSIYTFTREYLLKDIPVKKDEYFEKKLLPYSNVLINMNKASNYCYRINKDHILIVKGLSIYIFEPETLKLLKRFKSKKYLENINYFIFKNGNLYLSTKSTLFLFDDDKIYEKTDEEIENSVPDFKLFQDKVFYIYNDNFTFVDIKKGEIKRIAVDQLKNIPEEFYIHEYWLIDDTIYFYNYCQFFSYKPFDDFVQKVIDEKKYSFMSIDKDKDGNLLLKAIVNRPDTPSSRYEKFKFVMLKIDKKTKKIEEIFRDKESFNFYSIEQKRPMFDFKSDKKTIFKTKENIFKSIDHYYSNYYSNGYLYGSGIILKENFIVFKDNRIYVYGPESGMLEKILENNEPFEKYFFYYIKGDKLFPMNSRNKDYTYYYQMTDELKKELGLDD